MKSSLGLVLIASVGALAGCPGPDDTNPKTLWLAPQDSELDVQLVADEPPPF